MHVIINFQFLSSGGVLLTPEDSVCNVGYKGNLCHSCSDAIDGVEYTRSGLHDCSICPERTQNIVKIGGVFILLIAAVCVLLYVNLRKADESESSVVLRIMTNYVQIVGTIATFNLSWPTYLAHFFNVASTVNEATESYISFDCFMKESKF